MGLRLIYILIAAFTLGFFMSSCTKEREVMREAVPFAVKITNVPANYEQVNVHIKQVEVLAEDAKGNKTWVALKTRSGIYNISSTSNSDIIIAEDDLNAAKVKEIKVTFGDVNNIVRDRKTIPLQMDGKQQELHIKVEADLRRTESFTLVLDIDAASSVQQRSTGAFVLIPVVKSKLTSGIPVG